MAPLSGRTLHAITMIYYISAPSPDKWLGQNVSSRKSVASQGAVLWKHSYDLRQIRFCGRVGVQSYMRCEKVIRESCHQKMQQNERFYTHPCLICGQRSVNARNWTSAPCLSASTALSQSPTGGCHDSALCLRSAVGLYWPHTHRCKVLSEQKFLH